MLVHNREVTDVALRSDFLYDAADEVVRIILATLSHVHPERSPLLCVLLSCYSRVACIATELLYQDTYMFSPP